MYCYWMLSSNLFLRTTSCHALPGITVASAMVADKPTAPGRAKVVMTLGRSVTLSWTSPEDDGGCKIGNYIVEYYRVSTTTSSTRIRVQNTQLKWKNLVF